MTQQVLSRTDRAERHEFLALVYCVFIAGLCSIIYELLIATTASYFMGDAILFFSLTIGIYMAAMGAGSYASKYIKTHLFHWFTGAEILLGLVGGLSVPALYFAFSHTELFLPLYAVFTLCVGFLIGLEIPLLTRLLDRYEGLRSNIAHVLSLDYLGALVATVAFPFMLLPLLGTFKTSIAFGLVNMSIGILILWRFAPVFDAAPRAKRHLARMLVVSSVLLFLAAIFSGKLLRAWDDSVFSGRVVYAKETKFQKIVVTKDRSDIRLFLDGNLQFSSLDEYRYHEALVHVPFSVAGFQPRRVLLLGAGDGMAVREILKYGFVENVTLVDLDPAITKIATANPYFLAHNKKSLLRDDVVDIVHADAFGYLQDAESYYDLIIADLPDPNNSALARLYAKEFYRLVLSRLAVDGVFVTQATSPFFSQRAFWDIAETVKAGGFSNIAPYHAQVPSFGEWGFVMAAPRRPLNVLHLHAGIETRFLSQDNLAGLFSFDKDLKTEKPTVNTLDKPVLLSHYMEGWRKWAR
ncbi:MAG: polyamine aminopropyltransferase [Alphaproteobacteria bacterium]|nr:polyamine aminopropyltransferase [Alphaproteobacteria bacterium]